MVFLGEGGVGGEMRGYGCWGKDVFMWENEEGDKSGRSEWG